MRLHKTTVDHAGLKQLFSFTYSSEAHLQQQALKV